MTAYLACKHGGIAGNCLVCAMEPTEKHLWKLTKRVTRLERIVKAGFDSNMPTILEEIKDL